MKAVILVSLLVAASATAAIQDANPVQTAHHLKDILGRIERGHRASKQLRVPVKAISSGAPVTFETFADDMACSGNASLTLKLNVGVCYEVCPGFAVNITDFVQPPTNPDDAQDLCASMEVHTESSCSGWQSIMNYQCKACQSGDFWADCGGVYGALFMHTGCQTQKITDSSCTTCNATTITTFNQCKDVPQMGSIKALKLAKCSVARLNLLHSCDSASQVYSSYSVGQGMCMGGMVVKAGH